MPDRAHATAEGLRAGQTDAGDQLRLHLFTEHYEPDALIRTDDEAIVLHDDRHHGPDAARLAVHADTPDSRHWDFDQGLSLITGRGHGFLDDDGMADLEALWTAHLARAAWSGAGAARAYRHVTRHTVTIMPEGFPHRGHWELSVEQAGAGYWVVKHMSEIVNPAGEWTHLIGGIPDDYRLDEKEAVDLAERIAPTLEVGGTTAMSKLWQWTVAQRG